MMITCAFSILEIRGVAVEDLRSLPSSYNDLGLSLSSPRFELAQFSTLTRLLNAICLEWGIRLHLSNNTVTRNKCWLQYQVNYKNNLAFSTGKQNLFNMYSDQCELW